MLYGELGLVRLIYLIPSLHLALLTRLRESWMRENRTCSLSGGRRPALHR